MNHKYRYLLMISFNVLLTTSHAQDFIWLKTGEKIFGHIEYKKPFLAKSYDQLNDSIIYAVQDIKSFRNEDGYFSQVEGSLNSDFVERILEGKISLFRKSLVHHTPGELTSVQTPGSTQSFYKPGTSIKIDSDYFSKGDGDVLKANYDNLLAQWKIIKKALHI